MLATEHNLRFMKWLTEQASEAIRDQRFGPFKKAFLSAFFEGPRP
jgi:queuine tRNA-ribosyltransferase